MGKKSVTSRNRVLWKVTRKVFMTRFVLGIVVGIALATWGVEGVTNMVTSGVTKIQDGARTVQTEVTK
jgi:hypothetical protein